MVCVLSKRVFTSLSVKKVSDKVVSRIILSCLKSKSVADILPRQLLRGFGLMSFSDALYYVHALTDSIDDKLINIARSSIKFEEMLAYKLAEESIRKSITNSSAPRLSLEESQQNEFYKSYLIN